MSKIQQTQDYHLFKRIKGNRTINKSQVNRLYQSINNNPGIAGAIPIIVNEKYEVIDGQHRLEALKKLSLPVSYFVVDKLSLPEIQLLNSATRTWTPIDYAKSYSELGLRDYAIYLDFKLKYHLNHDVLLVYLADIKEDGVKNTGASFRLGKFKVGDEEYAHTLCGMLADVGAFYKRYQTKAFCLAYQKLTRHPNYDHGYFVSRLKRHHRFLLPVSCQEDYLRIFEKIWNYLVRDPENRIKLF